MNESEILREFMSGRHCAQCVFGAFADEGGYDLDETDRIACNFGGGMMMGQTCGAVTGALMAIGMLGGDKGKGVEFETKFKERFGSCICYDLLGSQTTTEAKVSGKIVEVCPGYVSGAIEIVREII